MLLRKQQKLKRYGILPGLNLRASGVSVRKLEEKKTLNIM